MLDRQIQEATTAEKAEKERLKVETRAKFLLGDLMLDWANVTPPMVKALNKRQAAARPTDMAAWDMIRSRWKLSPRIPTPGNPAEDAPTPNQENRSHTMAKTTVQLAEFGTAMKKLGYTVRIRTHSDFKAARVLDATGKAINAGNVLSPEHLAKHQAFYDYVNNHSVRDGDWIVTT